MKTIKAAMIFVLALPLMAMASAVYAGDVAAGADLAGKVCATCHGADGNTPIAGSPKLAGQHYRYLVQTLKEYREGKRGSSIMSLQTTQALVDAAEQARRLTDEEIESLAAYYSSLPGDLR
ncbi:MAG: c-type cytochrome [Gammaproteobacteria bacterium]